MLDLKRWHWITLGCLLLAAILIASFKGGNSKGEKVYVEAAATKDIESIVAAPGQVDPKVKVNISAHVIGKIDRLYFKEGDFVKKGDRLVDLERVNFIAQRDRVRSELANRRIEVRRSQIALANAERQFRRAQSMQQQGIQAAEVFDRAQYEYDSARAALASAQEGVRQAAAGLAQAEEDLARTTLHAPMSGKIVQLNAYEGEVVITGTMNNPGSVIAVLADLSEVLVEAEVTETEIVRIRAGQSAKIKVDAVPDHEYIGSVSEIGSSATARAGGGSGIRYFTVRIAFGSPDERLRPGMTAQVDIVTDSVKNMLAIPIQSVVERRPSEVRNPRKKVEEDDETDGEPKKQYVFVVRDGKAEMVEVKTGISSATHVAILSGIKPGDSLITGPFRILKKLRNKAPVEVQKEHEPVKKGEEEKES